MKFKTQKRKILFYLVIIFIFLLSCNLTPFLNDLSGTNYYPAFPTHFRCEAKKGLLFGADYRKAPSSDGKLNYISSEDLNFFLDFKIPEDNNPIGISIDYSYDITVIQPIVYYRNNVESIEDGITKMYKSGEGKGFWENQQSEGYFSGNVTEKTKIEYIKPEQESGETETNYWFVGYENYSKNSNVTPQVFLCFYTGEFNMDTVKAAGEEGFAEFCSLPEYGYFVCNPR